MAKSREQYIEEHGGDAVSFTLIDEATLARREREGDVTTAFMHTQKYLNIPKDERWNTKQLNSKLLAGILNGDSVDKIARSFIDVIGNNQSAAMRNARTMTTQAECGGRQDSYESLAAQGVEMRKVWIATPDDRTRESHLDIDGEEVGIDDEFSNGLQYPADPSGDGAEVYNCRCSMRTHIISINGVPISYERDETMHSEQMDAERERREQTEAKAEENAPMKASSDSADPIDKIRDSLMESYEYHRINNNLNASSADELGEEFFKVQFTKMDDDLKNTIADQFDKLSSKYDTTVQIIRPMDKMEYLVNKNAFATTFHDYNVDSSTIMFNPVKVTDVDRIKELVESGYSAQIDLALADRYVITHEFAHTLIDMQTPLSEKTNWLDADYGRIKSIRKEIDGVYNRYITEISTLDKQQKAVELEALTTMDEQSWQKASDLAAELKEKSIGRYSMVNSDEFMAECFAHHELGGAQNDYVDEIMEIIDKYFRR